MLRNLRLPALLASLLCAIAARPSADVLVVPDDHGRLEDAVVAAAPGDTILVRTAAEQGAFGVHIDKPLTIVGDPVCNVDLRFGGIHLAGSGGVLTLVNVEVDYRSADENGYPSLWGGGFDEVHLVGCRIVHGNLAPSGLITSSHPAIDLQGEVLLSVVDSELAGGNAGSDVCAPPAFYVDGRAAIHAPDASVLLVDSVVRGGNGGRDGPGGGTLDICCASCHCPGDLSTWGGHGGDGVVARELHAWRSQVSGGEGVTWYAFPEGTNDDPQGQPQNCGEQPDGAPFVVSDTLVRRSVAPLRANSSRPALGSAWTLRWRLEALTTCRPGEDDCLHAAVGFLVASAAPPREPLAFGDQWIYVDLLSSELLVSFPALSTMEFEQRVPNSLDVVGTTVTAQVALSTRQLSGPVVGIIVP